MTVVEKIESYLARRDMPFTHSEHRLAFTARELAKAEFLKSEMIAKPVVLLADGTFAMAVVPGDCMVDLVKLRNLMGVGHLRLATEQEICNLFRDCEVGAMPPLGNLYNVPVYIESGLALQDTIAFSAGTHRDVIHMRFSDFRRAVDGIVLPFAWRQAA